MSAVDDEQQLMMMLLVLIPNVVPVDRDLSDQEAGFMMRNTVRMARALLQCDVKLPLKETPQ